jgi:hypothetical protein
MSSTERPAPNSGSTSMTCSMGDTAKAISICSAGRLHSERSSKCRGRTALRNAGWEAAAETCWNPWIVLNERHLKRLMAEYVRYYHHDRTHLGLAKDTPVSRPMALRSTAGSTIRSSPRLGGLHHRTLHNSETDRLPWEAHRNTAKKHTSHESTTGDCRLPGKSFSSKLRARTVRNKCASGFREVLRIDNAILCRAA